MTGEEIVRACRYTDNCRTRAELNLFCKVEGVDVFMCRAHHREWTARVQQDPGLQSRCPRCAPAYEARRNAQAFDPVVTIADEPIVGPLADAIDRAMNQEGVLKPVRDRVLRRLAADTDAYVAAVLARTADRIDA
jgi:hypothetical protein